MNNEIFRIVGSVLLNDDDFRRGIRDVVTEGENTSTKLGKTLSKIGDVALKAAKVVAVGVGAVSTGLVAITKTAVDAYADYEQLVGGVETLFKTSSDKVLEYANRAYKTAGMSANEYMETVTSYSASLLQSLGGDTEKAADVADMAIQDMSDNANKMGTSMEMIQNAYNGFAKQNFTMLDNLKLGYGGTQEEMQRLLDDATKLSGIKYDITNLNDVFQAIHVIQGELGITGTTAKEASSTISGSISSMKASWTNLLVGFADGTQDLDQLIAIFIDNVGTVAENLVPRIQQVLSTLIGLIIDHLPQITAQIMEWLGTLVDKIIASLPPGIREIAGFIVDFLVEAFKTLVDIVNDVVEAFKDVKKWMDDHKTTVQILAIVIGTLTTAILAYNVAQAIARAGGLAHIITLGAQAIATGALTTATTIATAATSAFGAVMAFVTSPITLVVLAIGALIAIVVLLIKNWDKVKEVASQVWESVKTAVGDAIDSIVEFFKKIINFVKENWQGLLLLIVNPFAGAFKLLYDNCEGFRTFVDDFVKKIKDFFVNGFNSLKDGVVNIFTNLKNTITNTLNNLKNGAINIVTSIKDGFVNKFNQAKDKVTSIFNDVKEAIMKPIRTAKETVTGWIDDIKSALSNFGVKIKLPHFSIKNASLNPADWITNGIPKLSVEWYEKGGIFDKPTLFNTANGIKGVGEAGPEAVAPISELMKYTSLAVDGSNAGLESKLDILIDLLTKYLPLLIDKKIVLDTGELVGAISPEIDKKLGDINKRRERGN